MNAPHKHEVHATNRLGLLFAGIVQFLQFRYQKGVLYRLKALGERHNMDITIEGFHSWMWRGLSFLLPFLFVGYFFQAYNAWVLYKLSEHPEATWQIPMLSVMFLMLFIGNTMTTLLVVPQKIRERAKERYRLKSLSWAMKLRSQITVRQCRVTLLDMSFLNPFFSLFYRNRVTKASQLPRATTTRANGPPQRTNEYVRTHTGRGSPAEPFNVTVIGSIIRFDTSHSVNYG